MKLRTILYISHMTCYDMVRYDMKRCDMMMIMIWRKHEMKLSDLLEMRWDLLQEDHFCIEMRPNRTRQTRRFYLMVEQVSEDRQKQRPERTLTDVVPVLKGVLVRQSWNPQVSLRSQAVQLVLHYELSLRQSQEHVHVVCHTQEAAQTSTFLRVCLENTTMFLTINNKVLWTWYLNLWSCLCRCRRTPPCRRCCSSYTIPAPLWPAVTYSEGRRQRWCHQWRPRQGGPIIQHLRNMVVKGQREITSKFMKLECP